MVYLAVKFVGKDEATVIGVLTHGLQLVENFLNKSLLMSILLTKKTLLTCNVGRSRWMVD